jgi:hypothetical protein
MDFFWQRRWGGAAHTARRGLDLQMPKCEEIQSGAVVGALKFRSRFKNDSSF